VSEASPNTAQNWYVSRNDKQAGPYPGAVLKQLATTGKILPTDLVWKDGSDVRKPASQIKGLFPSVPPTIPMLPNQVTEPRNLPPPLPKVDRLYSGSKTESTNRLDSNGIPTPTSSVHVSLWSPIAIFIWSFFLSPLFGSYLLYRNWKALGKSDIARRSLYWFYGYLGLFIFVFLGVCIGNELIPMLVGRIAFGGLIVWMIKEAAPHVDYVNKNFGKAYERKSILKPLGVFGTCAFLLFLILIAGVLISGNDQATAESVVEKEASKSTVAGNSSSPSTQTDALSSTSRNVDLVKQKSASDSTGVTYETIVRNFLLNPTWKEGVMPDGTTFVNVTGTTHIGLARHTALIQFVVNGNSFKVYTVEIDGKPQDKKEIASFFYLMFETSRHLIEK